MLPGHQRTIRKSALSKSEERYKFQFTKLNIYNTKHPKGVTLSDNIITDNGINIGDYAPGANAWIYFDATASEIPSSKNVIYRNIIQACGGYGAKEKSADVIMDVYEAL